MEKTKNPYNAFLAGGLAGTSIDLTLHPLDYIKTRQHRGQKLDTTFRSFYKGISAALLASFPCAAIFWGVYMISKQYMLNLGLSLPKVESISSVLGSFAGCIVRNPFERIKQMMQVGENATLRMTFATILKDHGYKGIYKGFTALCIREIPFDTIQMLLFQSLRFVGIFNFGKVNDFLYGGIAGGISAYLTSPIDVVKTRIMTKPAKYQTLFKALNIIYQEEGIKAFWKGWVTRFTYISLGGTIYFGVFNYVYRLLTNS